MGLKDLRVVRQAGSREDGLVSKFILGLVLWALAAGWLGGQNLPPGEELPEPPPTGLSDGDRVLGMNSDVQRRVAGMIEKLWRERSYRLFVVVERSLISSNANNLAAQLQEAWLPEGGGLVVVYETDTRDLGFGRDLDPGEGMRPDETGVPAYELVRIITKALGEAEKKEGSGERAEIYVEALVAAICGEIEGYFGRKEAPVDGGRSLRLALVTVGALSLLALCGMGLGWLIGKADKRQADTRVFPEIQVPERLGASYGGGGGGLGYFGGERKEIG